VEPLTTLEPAFDTQPAQVDTLPSATPPPPAEIVPTETSPTEPPSPDVPDLVSIGHLAPFASADIGLLVLESGELTVQPSPVDYGILWDYSPLSGGLAYSSEFFHVSESNNISVSDLWVYNYQTGTTEKWLDDNVTRATWAPDGEHLTAAVYNPESEQIDFLLVSGSDQVKLTAECASMDFSWSPDGDMLAYVNALIGLNFGVDDACLGTYLWTFPNGISGAERDVSRVSDFDAQEFGGYHFFDQPLWALEQNALIYPDQPFWIVPLDGSPAFVPQTPGGEDPMNLPRPFGSLWSSHLNQLVGNVDTGPAGFGGVWVYQLSEDLSQIESYYRIGEAPAGSNSFINLVDWWNPGESILVLDG
ncbi:MAG: hypothetical protein KAS38_05495, partial [Anaerolineales bacterium]|nr:hypothetical protein [Anaerolineales bacterium]